MNYLGIYIYNQTRNQWLSHTRRGRTRWTDFTAAWEFAPGTEDRVEQLRTEVSGEDTTYTVALLH